MKATMLFLGVFLFSAAVDACDQPPFSERYENHGTATWTQGDDGCELQSTLLANDVTAAGVAHFQRRDGSAPLHFSFRLDLSALTSVNSIQSVSVASATSKVAVSMGGNASADLFRLKVQGNVQGTARQLLVIAACANGPSGVCTQTVPIIGDMTLIGVKLNIGTDNGSLQVWVDDDFDGAPTVSLEGLNNEEWIAVERVAIGMSSGSQAFVGNHADETMTFDRVAMRLVNPITLKGANGMGPDDDQFFHMDFESNGSPGCGDGAPLLTPDFTVVGTTCNGSSVFPTIASGSTHAFTPERIFIFSQEEARDRTFVLSSTLYPSLAVFVCSRQCGPSAHCLGGIAGITPRLHIPQLPAGDHIVVVKAIAPGNACGAFTLDLAGPLD